MPVDALSFRCKKCHRRHTAESHPKCWESYQKGEQVRLELQSNISRHKRPARILLLDIETLPGEYYAFDAKVDYLTADKQIKDWSISCVAAKWLFEPDVMGVVVSASDAEARRDKKILEPIWKLIDEAQVIVTQNGINFDMKKLNSRFISNGFIPPSKVLHVDTLKVAREVFGFTYNNLNELAKKLNIPHSKIKMEFDDWKKCLTNDQSAEEHLRQMLTYCKNDVAPMLEDVYLTMIPWIPNHPNMNIYSDNDQEICRCCGSTELKWGLEYPTPQGLWEGWRCTSCGAIGRGKGKENKIKSTSIV